MIGYNRYWPKRQPTPLEELICLSITAVMAVVCFIAYGVVRVAEWIGRRK